MKIGLVLAGGGGRGAYQIGVWKALKELGIDKYIQAVSGTSIGALNGVLFAQGDFKKAEDIWLGITLEKILPIDSREIFAKGVKLILGNKNINFIKKYSPKLLEQGNVSRQGLMDILNEDIDFKKVLRSNISLYAACTELPEIKSKYFKLNNYDGETVKRILCATSAIPSVYECEEIDARKYIDGGMSDNIPIQPIYGEGCDIIFVVHLSREHYIDRSRFPNARIIEIIPSSDQGGVFTGILDFSRESVRKRMIIGYEDTMNLIEPLLEIGKMQLKNAPVEAISSLSKSLIEKSKALTSNLKSFYKKDENKKIPS
ncbi:patatin-like phospholipase family protein [Clostridium polynesiense]|uniref:patatin-like phospholipase family protein n=1 Tax=Clostridium polynesiense TaxID=1325933 RepID=UPI00058CA936|nr:patatin-like phospholipase family protein [Clostridium polynesiense]